MSNASYIYNVLCFTTNLELFEPISILKQFMESTNQTKKKLNKENPLNFNYKINEKKILLSFHQINDFTQEKSDICYFADSYLIIIDLENDNTYKNLDEIIIFMKNLCDLEKTVFVLGLYSNAEKTRNNLNEENVTEYLEEKRLIYEYFESNIDSINDLNKTIDFILKEGFKKIEKKIKEGYNGYQTDSESNSHCFIF